MELLYSLTKGELSTLQELVNVIKTKTSRFARKQNGDTLLKPYNWKPLFWSDSYFVTSVSENSLTHIKTYIQNQ